MIGGARRGLVVGDEVQGGAEQRHARHGRLALERGVGAHEVAAVELEQRARHVAALERRRAAGGDDLAAVDQRQLVAVLRLVHVVRGDEHGDAARRRARRSSPRSCAATPGRRRRSARRGTGSAARAARRSRAPGAGASRRRASAVLSVLAAAQAGHLQRPGDARARAARRARCRCRRRTAGSPRRSGPRRARSAATCSRCCSSAARSGARCRSRRPCRAPAVGRRMPHSMRMVVDLPAPFGPRKPKTVPALDAAGRCGRRRRTGRRRASGR